MNVHLIYYAKGQYGTSSYQLRDLQRVISKFSGVDYDSITPRDVLECVYSVWMGVSEHYMRSDLMGDLFYSPFRDTDEPGKSNVMDAIKLLISNIRHCHAKYLYSSVPSEQKWEDFYLGDEGEYNGSQS